MTPTVAAFPCSIRRAAIQPGQAITLGLDPRAQIVGLGIEKEGETGPAILFFYALLPIEEELPIPRTFALLDRAEPLPAGAVVYDMYNIAGTLAGQIKMAFLVELPEPSVIKEEGTVERAEPEEGGS